jgi:hypothetical protein
VGAHLARGMVVTTEHLLAPDGHWTRGFAGEVDVLDAKSTIGITPGGRDHTWYARIKGGPGRGDTVVYLPGCKVAAIIDLGRRDAPSGDVWSAPGV